MTFKGIELITQDIEIIWYTHTYILQGQLLCHTVIITFVTTSSSYQQPPPPLPPTWLINAPTQTQGAQTIVWAPRYVFFSLLLYFVIDN